MLIPELYKTFSNPHTLSRYQNQYKPGNAIDWRVIKATDTYYPHLANGRYF